MATLLYGSGLRLLECCRLRVQDLDFGMNQIVVPDGKGAKDRVTIHARRGQEQPHRAPAEGGTPAPGRPDAGRRLGRAAVGPGPQVSDRRPRVAVAMGLSGHSVLEVNRQCEPTAEVQESPEYGGA